MFTLQTFWLDTKTSEDDEVVSWSLSSPADLQGLVIPTAKSRRSVSGRCAGNTEAATAAPTTARLISMLREMRSLTRRWMYAVVV
jgi:phage-related protein